MTFKIRTWGGIGDVLLLTPSLRAVKQAHPDWTLKVYASRPVHLELLRHNPHVDVLKHAPQRWPGSAYSIQQGIAAFMEAPGASPRWLPALWRRSRVHMAAYASLLPTLTRRRAIDLIAEMLDIAPVHYPLEVFLTDEELARARARMARYERPVVVHTTSVSSVNKNWPADNWAALVRRNPDLTFVQLGTEQDVPVEGAIDLRGMTSLRESIALTKFAAAFVGVESSLAHATNATGTPAAVLFGPTSPEVWAHPNTRVVSRRARCSPCIDLLLDAPCPYDAFCIHEIAVEAVEAALYDQLGQPFASANGAIATCVSSA